MSSGFGALTPWLLGLVAALFYALTSVLQLLRRPRWLLGNLAEVAAFVLHFLALRRGSLLLVQTVLVAGLLFALPMAAAFVHQRLRKVEWAWTVVLVVGLAVFLGTAQPTAGRDQATGRAWVWVLLVGLALVGGLIIRAPRRPGGPRATYLGTSCGILFGINAALTKGVGHLLGRGIFHTLASWQLYVLLILAGLGFLLSQSAFQAGPLAASLPMLSIADPVAAAAIGVLAFHEHLAASPLALTLEVASAAAMMAAVFGLARSPLVSPPTMTATDLRTD